MFLMPLEEKENFLLLGITKTPGRQKSSLCFPRKKAF
jgi:hypothetical protein